MTTLVDYIDSVKTGIPGIQSLTITDRDGVEVFTTSSAQSEELQILSVIFSLTHEQCQKLDEFGETNFLLTEYQDGSSFMQVNLTPLILSIKAKGVARNVIMDAADKVKLALRDLRKRVASSTVD